MEQIKIFLFLFLISLIFPVSVSASTILSTGFETGTVESWSSSGGGATATASGDIVRSGSYSLKVQHDKTSSYGFQTIISNLEPGMYYKASSYGKTPDTNVAGFFVRVSWYQSSDGSGSQLSQVNDSNSGSSSVSDWQLLNEVVQAPSNANSAKIRLVLNSKTSGTMAYTYFDDVAFEEYTQTPSPSPTPTTAPTSNPAQTPTITPTPTSTPTKTPTPKPRVSPSPNVLGEKTSSVSSNASDLRRQLVTPSPSPEELIESGKNFPIFPAFLIVGGFACLSFAGFSLFRKIKSEYNNENEEVS